MKTLKGLEKTIVYQHDQSDCGVACLASLIQYYGGRATLETLRELSGTTKQGTTLLGLYQSANQFGFMAQGCEADLTALKNHGSPVILHVTIGNRLQHYVVCYGFKNNHFIIGDPAKGIILLNEEELNTLWISKTCLTLEITDRFIKQEVWKNAKKNFFLELIKEDRQLLIISMVLGLITSVLGMAMAVFSQKLIDDILPSKDIIKLVSGIVLVAFLLLFRAILSTVRSYFLIRQSKDFNNRIIQRFYGALMYLPKPFFDTRKIGELVSRLNDTQRIQQVIQKVASEFVINILMTMVSLGFLYYYAWQVGLIATIALPFYFGLIYRFNTKIIAAQKEVLQTKAHSQSNYIASMQGIATIKNNNKQTVFEKINKFIYGNFQEKVFDLGKINLRLSLYSGIFSVLFLLAILIYTSIGVVQDQMMIGELTAILGIAGSLLPAVAGLALIAIPINEAKVAFERMFEFTDMKRELSGEQEIKHFESIGIKNLGFRFAGRKPLLTDISLELHKGECAAIVGESGSGKSTLGQILQKFYKKEKGDIIVNSIHCLNDIDIASWRDQIGVVEQEIKVFNGTLLDNILLGSKKPVEEVINFCNEYGFHNFFQSLPQGYATILGEEGINLSGGQKQILALARVLYKKPSLLILDEYTSAMDRRTEEFSISLLKRIKSEIAILLISHRMHSLPKIADRIYVIENGKTVAHGSHQKLLQTKNFYSEFWHDLEFAFEENYQST